VYESVIDIIITISIDSRIRNVLVSLILDSTCVPPFGLGVSAVMPVNNTERGGFPPFIFTFAHTLTPRVCLGPELSILCFSRYFSLSLFLFLFLSLSLSLSSSLSLSFSLSLSLFFFLSFSRYLFLSSFQFLSPATVLSEYRETGRRHRLIRCALILIFSQTMAATKRNAGLTSAVPRATLNDEELVRTRLLVTVPRHHRCSASAINKP